MAAHSIFLPQDPHEMYEKAKTWDRKMSSPGRMVSNMLLRKSGGQLRMAPESMKRLGQSRNDTQLWKCLGAKVKSNAVENNVARNLERWVRESR